MCCTVCVCLVYMFVSRLVMYLSQTDGKMIRTLKITQLKQPVIILNHSCEILQLDVIQIDADECLYHSEQHELMLYLSISLMKLITNNVLVSMGCHFLIFNIFGFCVYICHSYIDP